jgi:hypothetical protein
MNKAGILTSGSSSSCAFPIVSVAFAEFVPGHSGGPVPDFHGIPSFVFTTPYVVNILKHAVEVKWYLCFYIDTTYSTVRRSAKRQTEQPFASKTGCRCHISIEEWIFSKVK